MLVWMFVLLLVVGAIVDRLPEPVVEQIMTRLGLTSWRDEDQPGPSPVCSDDVVRAHRQRSHS